MYDFLGFLVAAITLTYFIFDRYFSLKLRIIVNRKNTMVARYYSPGSPANGRWSLVLIDLSLTNLGRTSTSIRDIRLRYKFNEIYEFVSSDVMLKTALHHKHIPSTPCVIIDNGANHIVVMGWKDFREINSGLLAINPGETIRYNQVFVLDIKNYEDLARIKSWDFEIDLFNGKKIYQPIDIDNNIMNYKQSVIRRELFESDDNGDFIIPPRVPF